MDEFTFMKAVGAAKPGERIVYHTGLLMADRQPCGLKNQHSKNRICCCERCAKARKLAAVAAMAWRLHERGIGVLTQRRVGEACEYALTMSRYKQREAA